jgi:hypothetical protein
MKKETLEEAKTSIYKDYWNIEHTQWIKSNFLNGFEAGAKWQQEQDKNKFSELSLFLEKEADKDRLKSLTSNQIRTLIEKFKKK